MGKSKIRLSVKLSATFLCLILAALSIEVMARVLFQYRDEIRFNPLVSKVLQQSLSLDPYEMPAPNGSFHWVLRPGYSATLEQLLSDKRQAGRIIGAKALELIAKRDADDPNNVLRINSDGFKGEEIDPTHSKTRILVLGDSVTFGLGGVDFPSEIANKLNSGNQVVEVVNGGVEGYSPRNIINEFDRYEKLNPEIVIILTGWNALFSLESRSRFLKSAWMFDRIRQLLTAFFADNRKQAMKLYARRHEAFSDTHEVRNLSKSDITFMDKIALIIDRFKNLGSQVVVLTLPGLFVVDQEPSEKSLKIGHLPPFTRNPYVLAKLTQLYNKELIKMAKAKGVRLIDMSAWSEGALMPRDEFFLDSVHLTGQGLKMMGHHIADELSLPIKNETNDWVK